MTIKMSKKSPASETTETAAAPAPGGATIADRFKLDAPSAAAPKPAGKSALMALIAGLLALAVAGILAFVIYQHWEFLKAA